MLKTGQTFYYANRNTKKAEKCVVIDHVLQYPLAYIAKKEDTGEIFKCYHGFGCFETEEAAHADAQINENRIIY